MPRRDARRKRSDNSTNVYGTTTQRIRVRPGHRPGRIAQLWIDAWNDRDADRLAALFAENAEFVNVTGLWWHDREAIRKAHAYGLDTIFSESTISLLEKLVKWVVGTPMRTHRTRVGAPPVSSTPR